MLNTIMEKPGKSHRLLIQGAGIKSSIHKSRYIAESREEKRKNVSSMKKTRCIVHIEGHKKQLSIQIPKDYETKPFIFGSKVKSGSDFADTSETGAFYGLTLKKGQFRRFNEDRVTISLIYFV